MAERRFTLREANRLLQWLESKLAELDPYRRELRRHRERSVDMVARSRGNGSTHAEEDLHRVQQMIEELEKSVQDIVEQISSRGIVVRDLERGLVDFPSLRDGRVVFLCWLRGEPEIGYWHETDAGFASRQPL